MMPLTENKKEAYEKRVPKATRDEPMSKHTSFRVGGTARLHVVANSSEALIEAVTAALECDVPFFLYGGGSNLLVSDDGYEGVMIQAANRGLSFDGERMKAESGVITGMAARQSVEHGLGGFEWAIGVPGTIGGAVFGNAGCYGGEIKDSLESVEVFDLNAHEKKIMTHTECAFAYRESLFKHHPYLILSATFRFKPNADIAAGKARMNEIMKTRKEKQPLEASSAGCAFKNPPGHSAGQLIDSLSLKGLKIGDIQVSDKHANFLVNRGQATAQDIITIISVIKMKVRDELGVQLEEEVQLAGF